jgi:ParB family chromosome partitioning protein
MTTMEAPRTSRPAMPSARGITVRIDEIEIPATARPYNASAVVELSNSIAAIGLQSAPTLVERDGKYRLVAGRHRLEAMKILRHESVFARVVDFDDIAARLWTLSENLHRNELSALERSEAIAEYAQLWENRRRSSEYEHKGVQIAHPEAQPVQVAHPERRYEQRGDSLAARNLGVSRYDLRRAKVVAALADETKTEAETLGLADSQAALIAAAKKPTSPEQITVLREIAERGRVVQPTAPYLKNLENLSGGEFARWIKITTPKRSSASHFDARNGCGDPNRGIKGNAQ